MYVEHASPQLVGHLELLEMVVVPHKGYVNKDIKVNLHTDEVALLIGHRVVYTVTGNLHTSVMLDMTCMIQSLLLSTVSLL